MESVKKKIKISGTYGDPVKLRLDGGYVSTKHGDTARIKSVDVDTQTVDTYMYGRFDFSRISSSWKVSTDADAEYIETINSFFKRIGIKIGTVLSFNENLETIENIIMPNMNDIFEPVIITNERTILISDKDDFHKNNAVYFTPYTFEEKIDNLLSSHTNYNNEIRDVNKYKKELLELIDEYKR